MSDERGRNVTDGNFAGIPSQGENPDGQSQQEGFGDVFDLADVSDAAEPSDAGAATVAMPPLPLTADQSFQPANAEPVMPIEPVELKATVAKKSKLPLIITGIVLAVLVVAAIAGFFTARWYFQDKAAPGVTFGGSSVAGQSADQLKSTVNSVVERTKVAVKDGDGVSCSGSLSDFGVSVDVDKTVSRLLSAKHDSRDVLGYVNEVNPFDKTSVPLEAKTDKPTLRTFITNKFVQEDDQAVPSTATYDASAHAFVAVEGHGGRSPQMNKVISAVSKAVKDPGHTSNVTISYETIDVPISLDEAQNIADQANARLNAPIILDNGQGKTFQIPADTVASWLKSDADLEKGTLSLSYDDNAIAAFVQQQVPAQLNQDAVDQEDAVDDNGTVLATMVKGVNGVKVKNVDALAPKIEEALKNGQGATIPVDGDVENFKTVQKKSEYRIVVDRSAQTATVYHNNQAVKTFPVCTGTTGKHETDLGTFTIYLKYKVQDMTGLNDDGSRYLSKGVKWVSYFYGGEGFHTASWNNYGIAHGDPAHYGSHGCVNMYEADSQWIYDNCPEGTIVQVVGDMPSGPVR